MPDPIAILVFILVLGVLIFVHELGHFVVAKWCGIYVFRFSLGFGPRLLRFKWGQTEYCISVLPFGGYVKMAGQEDLPSGKQEASPEIAESDPDQEDDSKGNRELRDEEIAVPEDQKFFNKTPAQRIAVTVAGPLMNVVLGFVIYYILALAGTDMPTWFTRSKIGGVEEGSPADEAGFKFGDIIRGIDGKPVSTWPDVMTEVALNVDKSLDFEVDREGETLHLTAAPVQKNRTLPPTLGINAFRIVGIKEVPQGSPASLGGIKKGDVIERIAGKPVDFSSMDVIVSDNVGKPTEVEVVRNGERVILTITPERRANFHKFVFMDPEEKEKLLYVGPPLDGDQEIAQAANQSRRRIPPPVIVAVDGESMEAEALYGALLENPDSTVQLTLLVPKDGLIAAVTRYFGKPLGKDWGKDLVEVEYDTGGRAYFGVEREDHEERIRYSVVGSFGKATKDVWRDMGLIWKVLKKLATRSVSPRLLAGPVGIYQFIQASFVAGLKPLLAITAMISINLAVINLFPLPVLDGGHILFCTLESVRGKPMDRKYQEALQQIGIVLLLMLMLYVTWNDVRRLRVLSPPEETPQAVESAE